jgi:hypothetical protein
MAFFGKKRSADFQSANQVGMMTIAADFSKRQNDLGQNYSKAKTEK